MPVKEWSLLGWLADVLMYWGVKLHLQGLRLGYASSFTTWKARVEAWRSWTRKGTSTPTKSPGRSGK